MYKEEIKELIDDLTAWTSTLTSTQHKDVRARTIINDACGYLRAADRYMHRPVLCEIKRGLACMRNTGNRRKFMRIVRELIAQNLPVRTVAPVNLRSGDVFCFGAADRNPYEVVSNFDGVCVYMLHRRKPQYVTVENPRADQLYNKQKLYYAVGPPSKVYILKDSEKVTGPVGFEEIRSAVNDPTTTYDRLAALLSWYEGDMPAQAVVEYVKGNMGFVPVVCWSTGISAPSFDGFVAKDVSQPWVAAHTCVGGQRVPAYDFTNTDLFERLDWLVQRVLMDHIRIPMVETVWRPFYAEQDHQSAHDTNDHLWSALRLIESWIDDGCPEDDFAAIDNRTSHARSGDWGGFHSGISALGAATFIEPHRAIHAAATTMARLEITDPYQTQGDIGAGNNLVPPHYWRSYDVVFNHWLDHFNRLVLEQVLRLHAKTKGGKS